MTDQFVVTINTLIERIRLKTQEIEEMKRLVNGLCREADRPLMYRDIGQQSGGNGPRPDQFYGKTPIVAAREFLEMQGRALTLEEIFEGLSQGGFDFDAQGWNQEQARLRNLSISLGKNTAIFHRLPNGYIGLVKFYPDIQAEKKRNKAANKPVAESSATMADSEDLQEEADNNQKAVNE